ncbi:MAG TPA: glucoamylase family protein [Candidatus Limnocylindrales bacterium]|nr:glucoamylase family protein [Candidatus Limnocylindrales bacterium]
MRPNPPLRDPPSRVRRLVRPPTDLDEPILAELFSAERLEEHARTLARAQVVTTEPRRGRPVQPRIAENGRVLVESYRVLARAIKDERAITPAAEWLVDNFPIIDEQLREIRDDLPPDYYDELPKLAEGHLEGYPRVLGLAWAYIAHTDSLFEPESLRRMVRAYQEVEPLTLGELWAVAISLRILLVDNVRRIADQIVRGRAARQKADELADSLLGLGPDSPEAATAALHRLSPAAFPAAARVQLFQRLRDQDPETTPALRWLEGLVAEQGTTAEEMVRLEHQRQATMNVTVRNVITSMRLISWFDWAQFVESTSLVDDVLRAQGSFSAMDFATRDRYRHAIENLARRADLTEIEVATRAVAMAEAAPVSEAAEASSANTDPGFYLIGDGRAAFEAALGVRVPLATRLRRAYSRGATTGYLGTVVVATALIVAVPLLLSRGADSAALILLALLALGPASDLAIALVNRAVTDILGPVALSRLDLDDGVPPAMRTLVVVPTLLTSEAVAAEQVNGLEVHYLANREGDVRFALLSDWADAPTQRVDGDDEILSAANAAVDRLNERHGEAPGGGARFLLFHRERRWNEAEGSWIGWERKRGKLHELNELLRGSTTTGLLTSGRPSSTPPADVRYVVTLDADTRLPRGAVGRLVGTMAHPLNRPVFDPAAGRVTQGYGILQPRITPTLPAEHEASIYQRVFAGSAGIDPYSSAVSDVYQDMFGEGSFTGKGIYDVDAFRAALAERVPENTLLSHDLFEGIYARAGLVTDVELFDEYPSNYLVEASRQHRWARGDWQLLPWILGRARDPTGGHDRTALPAIARWKMVDNLRRTLSAPLAVATLVAAWTVPTVPALLWTAFVVGTLVIPPGVQILAGLKPRRQGISKRSHLRAVGEDVAKGAAQVGIGIVLAAHQAWLMVDAIARTLARVYVTRRHLLEWTTAAQAKATHDLSTSGFYAQMAGGVAAAVVTAGLVLVAKPSAIWIAVPFLALWFVSPVIARWISLPPPASAAEQLSDDDVGALRVIARRTWRFFEAFVGPEDNHLPPDNFQDEPAPLVAHRTSPTNIGMYLLATVTARDFGWIGTLEMVERLEATLATIDRLERFRGHLYNWYDTRDLRRLEPMYVSSVDSGNLAGHLIVMANACRQMVDEPLPVATAFAGIEDALTLARAAAGAIPDDRRSQTLTRRDLAEALELPGMSDVPPTPEAMVRRLDELAAGVRTLADVAAALTAERGDTPGSELLTWTEAARSAVASHQRDIALLRSASSSDHPPTIAELADPSTGEADDATREAATLERRLRQLADRAQRLFEEMDFSFLFDPTRKLFSIGYRTRDGVQDPSYYDLLASEARLTSFLAIAKGDIPADHWFRLGRALTPVGRGSALVSWSGSMFEYLMPSLVMREPADSLLGQTFRLVVARQMSYAGERNVPWGISESAFNARDLQQAYQYSSFGVPGLGLKRGLREDLVVTPYATALGAMIRPHAAVENFSRLARAGASGAYGFREALDYTTRRLPEGASVAVVKSYMAHHQGMILVAIGNVLNDGVMIDRFHADPLVEATELLLHERMPRDVLVARPRAEEAKSAADVRDLVPPVLRRFNSPHDAIPRTHILSNGRYAVMMTAAGSGYSRWGGIAVTRWREDVTRDPWGSYLFLRDMQTGAVWSAGHQPSGTEADSYEVIYSEDHIELARRDGPIATAMSVVVSAEHDAEIRRVSVTNLGSQVRDIELTSYAEVALSPQAADVAHPAFQNLFVQTEFVGDIGALLATRRPRARDERPIWAAHVAAVEEDTSAIVQYETDRARFLGRGRSIREAVSILDGRPLSNTVGAVLDPIFSLRCRVRLAPGTTAHVTYSTVVAETRDDVLDLVDKFRETGAFERASTLAWTQAQVQLHHLGIESDEAHLFQRLANRILYSDRSLRPSPARLARNERGAPGLWAHGISGDLPIVVVRIGEAEDFHIVRQLLRAHEYWRLKLLDVDLVILNEHGPTYSEDFHGSLEGLVRTSQSTLVHGGHPAHGGVYVLRSDQLPVEDRTLLTSVARAVLLSRRGTLADQVIRLERPEAPAPPAPPPAPKLVAAPAGRPRPELEFFNGLGGFADDGNEYVAIIGPGQSTPAPWLNVIANPLFGFQVSESGSGYTWSGNSRENQLTPWSNDPVSDPVSEAIYLRDDDTGQLWGPTAQPIRLDESTYVARHGAGYSRFQHGHDGIDLDLVQFVPLEEPLKVSLLTIENRSGRTRRLSVTAYAEWVLGTSRGDQAHRIVTALEPETGALLARNPWNTEFGGRVALLDLGGRQTSWTADRTEFLGRNGAPDQPAALERGYHLRSAVGAGLDPCAALQTRVELADGARTQLVVLLGEAADAAAAAELVRRGRTMDHEATLREVARHWDDIQGTVQVRTPDRSMDIMLNRWLIYQALACRVWARTATYQAGGAFGFRDQLQDVIALVTARRDLARDQILLAASRQFPEGDVQHWWHPPSGRGVRTRISDDRLWLPYAVDRYLAVTADRTVLDETVPWIDGPPLRPDQSDEYFQPETTPERDTLYEHCAAAIDVSLAFGVHGLPLIGSGDWNDGMNRVGHEGRGESVWLGWFLSTVLAAFAPIAEARGDAARAQRWRASLKSLRRSLERHGWDGDWYRRAYFDDGTPLGSAANAECRIDSIAQSWSVLSGAADPGHAARAMAAVEEYLLRRGDGLVLLFTPPFDRGDVDPGYIKGYLPGVRENGGQYTHGAIWSVLAFAALGDGDKAGELFSILNPINHASTRAGVHRYKVEPYVMAADIYAEPPHVGRGGWTWYTGSAGWMYQAGVEWILGFRLRGTNLLIEPCIPRAWPRYAITFRYRSTRYEIDVENPTGVCRGVVRTELDGLAVEHATGIPIVDDGATHRIRVVLG